MDREDIWMELVDDQQAMQNSAEKISVLSVSTRMVCDER